MSVVDDEFVSRKKAQKIMAQYGECDIATNGAEAFEAFRLSKALGELGFVETGEIFEGG